MHVSKTVYPDVFSASYTQWIGYISTEVCRSRFEANYSRSSRMARIAQRKLTRYYKHESEQQNLLIRTARAILNATS